MDSMRQTSLPSPEVEGDASCASLCAPAEQKLLSGRELSLLVYRQMRAFTGPHRDLDDLAQTALEQILIARFKGQSKFATFTHSVCYHVWLKHLRFGYRFRALFVSLDPCDTEELPCTSERSDATSLIEDHRRFMRLYQALDRVAPKRRAVVTLRDMRGLEIQEIATIMDASEATVRTRLRDGRKQLRHLLRDDPEFSLARDEECPLSPSQELPCLQT
jgi:RNA polymerase sigma factor (sigma-70 family)